MNPTLKKELQELALRIRIGAMEEFNALGFGHVGGSLSIADLLAVLYGAVMKVDPANPTWPERDKLVCSKGHAGPGVYSALAVKGFFPYEQLKTLNVPGTNLPSHCDKKKTPGVDMTTGSLGQGASTAAGLALGEKLRKRDARVFTILGDGEINEGQVWEAAMFAAAKKLDNLYYFIDWNKKQLDGYVADVLDSGDLEAKFRSFGFDTVRIDGNDIEALYDAIEKASAVKGVPHAIVMDTVKGKGIKKVEETMANHSITFKPGEAAELLEGLKAELAAMQQ